mmetsp:Transcript_58800/g.156170  ORF Transcript_58800/g.156170 Transcript_58800/m.156170 type:complete len:228 (+) Transcript_58800:173-856(+)
MVKTLLARGGGGGGGERGGGGEAGGGEGSGGVEPGKAGGGERGLIQRGEATGDERCRRGLSEAGGDGGVGARERSLSGGGGGGGEEECVLVAGGRVATLRYRRVVVRPEKRRLPGGRALPLEAAALGALAAAGAALGVARTVPPRQRLEGRSAERELRVARGDLRIDGRHLEAEHRLQADARREVPQLELERDRILAGELDAAVRRARKLEQRLLVRHRRSVRIQNE